MEYWVGRDFKNHLIQLFSGKPQSGKDGPAPCFGYLFSFPSTTEGLKLIFPTLHRVLGRNIAIHLTRDGVRSRGTEEE